MKELLKVINKKLFILLSVSYIIFYCASFGVSFAFAKYITSPITVDKIQNLVLVLIILYVIEIITGYITTLISETVFLDSKYNMELYYFKKLEDMDFNNLNESHTGYIYSLIDKTVYSICYLAAFALEHFAPVVIGLGAFIYMTARQSKTIALFCIIIFILTMVVRYFMNKNREETKNIMHKKLSTYNATYIDLISNILTIRKLHIEPFARKKISEKSDEFLDILQVSEKKYAYINVVFRIFIYIIYIIILLAIILDIKNGIDALPFLVFYISIMGKIENGMFYSSRLIEMSIRAKNDKIILNKTLGLLNHKNKSKFENAKIINGEFYYKKRSEKFYFPYFELNEGDKISIMGESGQGKSTILNILAGFYSLKKGKMIINNKQIHNNMLDPVFISQEVDLFDLTIWDNITLGRDIKKEYVEELLKDAGLYDWYKKLPKGLDEMVGEKGIKLSVGQKQRLNIIRGILIDSNLYFFDEPTSNLDSESEEKISKMIKKYLKDKTYIIVTHRPNLKKLCNRQFIMKEHTLKEK